MNILRALALLVLWIPISHAELDEKDIATYAVVDRYDDTPSTASYRVLKESGKWRIDTKHLNGTWAPFKCVADCDIEPADPESVREFLPEDVVDAADPHCIHNSAILFCRYTLPAGLEIVRHYVGLPFQGGIMLFKIVPVDAQTGLAKVSSGIIHAPASIRTCPDDVTENKTENASSVKITSRKEPVFPPDLLADGIEGEVRLRFHVDEAGKPSKFCIMNADNVNFVLPVVAAIAQWRFEPIKRNGRAVAVWIIQPYRFRIAE